MNHAKATASTTAAWIRRCSSLVSARCITPMSDSIGEEKRRLSTHATSTGKTKTIATATEVGEPF